MFKKIRNKFSSFSARTIERSIRKGVRKQPRGALTFQYRVFNGKIDLMEVNNLKKKFGFKEVFLLHGVAMRVNDRAIILTGPRGSGKTTVMNNLARLGKVRPVEDGIVVIGQKKNGFFVVESGTLPWRQTRATIKRFSPIKGHQVSRKGLRKTNQFTQETAIYEGALSESIASFTTKNRSKKIFEPIAIPLGKVVLVSAKQDLHKPLKINGQKVEETSGLIFNKKTILINPEQNRSTIIKQMQKAVLN
ncbi:MAG: hypothetical protein PHP82_02795 [Candidatus ainarchaeum sp.]|nr:hypothetical protein [Candidatus ainarchaeum sp.]